MFEVHLSVEAARFYERTTPKTARILNRAFRALEVNPIGGPNIRILHGELKGRRRYRAGSIRIIYWIELEKRRVWVEAIGSRGNIYR